MTTELTDGFFEKAGFDVSQEPFTKDCPDGKITVYKNYVRDASGNYDGYFVVRPLGVAVKTVEDYLS